MTHPMPAPLVPDDSAAGGVQKPALQPSRQMELRQFFSIFGPRKTSRGRSPSRKCRHKLDVGPAEWARLRTAVFARDGYACVYCGAKPPVRLHCDHIVPRSGGGASTVENLATACAGCNCSKGAKSVKEWQP